MYVKRSVTFDFLIALCVVYIGVSAIFPPIRGYFRRLDVVICTICNLIILVISIQKVGRCYQSGHQCAMTISIVVYMIVVPYVFGMKVWANRYIDLLFFITAPLALEILKTNRKLIAGCVRIILLFACITWILTASGLQTQPYLSRKIKSVGEWSTEMKQNGIGGYEFIYFCLFLGIMFFYTSIKKKKIVYLILAFLNIYIIYLSNYRTAFFLFILGTFICLYVIGSAEIKVFVAILIGLILVSLQDILSMMLPILRNLSNGGKTFILLASIKESPICGILNAFFEGRGTEMMKSILSIRNSYGIGIVLYPLNTTISGLGQHSYLLDTISLYGLIVGSLYLIIVFNRPRKYVFITMPLLLLGIINNFTPSIALAVYFIVPYMIDEEIRMSSAKAHIKNRFVYGR